MTRLFIQVGGEKSCMWNTHYAMSSTHSLTHLDYTPGQRWYTRRVGLLLQLARCIWATLAWKIHNKQIIGSSNTSINDLKPPKYNGLSHSISCKEKVKTLSWLFNTSLNFNSSSGKRDSPHQLLELHLCFVSDGVTIALDSLKQWVTPTPLIHKLHLSIHCLVLCVYFDLIYCKTMPLYIEDNVFFPP